ncbi:uncharacterized protein [Epargyreus clarus]|uniref:uncharacterized protein n=1 Tax=Epargyreus clarus TaxID=520877 RepID=UPI003C2D04E3
MVFSQTSHKTQSILKVVELDRLKHGKSQQVKVSIGELVDSSPVTTSSAPAPDTTSLSEEFLKTEPVTTSAMFHDSDCEFFQDLVPWCVAPVEETVVQSIDLQKNTETRAHDTNTLHTPISPHGWDVLDANSPTTQAGMYNSMSSYPVSPNVDTMPKFRTDTFDPMELINSENKVPFQEQFLDINSDWIRNLPVVIGDLASEKTIDMNPWQLPESVGWQLHDTDYTKTNTTIHNTMPFIHQDDSLDKFVSVIPREVERNDVVVSEYIINTDQGLGGDQTDSTSDRRVGALSVNVPTRDQGWFADVISTPEVLSYVEQLEKEKCTIPSPISSYEPIPVISSPEIYTKIENSPPVEYEPITPKSESHVDSDNDDVKSHTSKRRRHDSEDSDETYTPYTEHTPRKNKRRKANIPIKDMIRALEESQQLTKARRGRPPKRRESTVSSVHSVDDNSSTISTHEMKYRELRDKNNEASKKSRMNRKLKELQMEQLAVELEERNKKLRVRADILEDMTKKLREAFMAAVSQKKAG